MEKIENLDIVLDYLKENNISYKICEYAAGKGSGYDIGTIVPVLYVDAGVIKTMEIDDAIRNRYLAQTGCKLFMAICKLSNEKGIKKMIEKGARAIIE